MIWEEEQIPICIKKKYTDARHTATFGRFGLNKLYVLWCLEKPRSPSCKYISPINFYANNQLFSRSKAGNEGMHNNGVLFDMTEVAGIP